ncbi:hypothetical protein MTO96_021961 [Rhipicephalus appendiculatus]
MRHIHKDAVWASAILTPDGLITLPLITTLSAVNSGLWRFDSPFAGTTISVDDPLLSAIQFVASEKLFVGWHILHSTIGVATDGMQLGSSTNQTRCGETVLFDGLFKEGFEEPPRFGNLVQNVITKAVNGPVLTTAAATSVLSSMRGGPDCKIVAWNDFPDVSPHSLWQNRLMHSHSMYELRDYVTGGSVAGAPAPGEAPTEFPRGHDEWADNSFDFGTKTTPYPFFSTVWSGWMDSATRHVLALQQKGELSRWRPVLCGGNLLRCTRIGVSRSLERRCQWQLILGQVSPFVSLHHGKNRQATRKPLLRLHRLAAQTMTFTRVVSDLKKLIGPTGWVRDLCVDGDVENNPGPVSCPRTYEEMSGLSFIDWVRDKEGQGTDMLSGAWADVSAVTMIPNSNSCMDVNNAIIMSGSWYPSPDGQMKHFRVGSWTTVLYPTSVRCSPQLLCVADIRRKDTFGKHVDSVPSQELCSLVYTPSPKPQEGPFPPAQVTPAKAQPKKSPSFFAEGPAQQNTQAQPQPVVEGAGSAAYQRQPSPSPSPEVVVAAVGRSGEVLSSSMAMGQGVAFPLFDGGHYPFLHRRGTVAIVIGEGVPVHGAQVGLTYAYRIPITVTQKTLGDSIVVRLGDKIVPEANIDDDDVPLLYRCWAAPGNRISHILKDAVWADIALPHDGLITLPNITTLSAVNSGVWRFDKPFAGTTINVDHLLLSAIQFVASERLFVGWHILHSAMGVPTDSMQLGSSGEWPQRGETIHFHGLFGDRSGQIPRLGGLVLDLIAKAVNGPVLTTVTGVPFPYRLFPQRNWEPQVMDFTNSVRIAKACPTPMTDIVVFKYSTSLPKEFLPFLCHTTYGNKDIYDKEEPCGVPPIFYFGPFIYAGGPRYNRVRENEIAKVSPHSLWLNRLMHSQSMFELRDYVTGDRVAGAPAPGEAPIEFPRGHDDWVDRLSNLGGKTTPYPFFSTVWSGWMDSSTRHVLALLQRSGPVCSSSGDWGDSIPRKETPVAADPPPSQPSRVLPPREQEAGSQEAVTAPSSPRSPSDDVHIGNGFFVPTAKWLPLKDSRTDGTFARGLMRCLWKREELVNRSVTGIVCRRYLHQGGKAKPGLSPRKRDAMQMAYYNYVKTHPNTLHTVDRRLRDLNKHLASFLHDLAREERLAGCPKM